MLGTPLPSAPKTPLGLWDPKFLPVPWGAAASLIVTPLGEVGDIGDSPEVGSGVPSRCGMPVGMGVPAGDVPGLPCYKYPLIKGELSGRSNPLINWD